MHPSYGCGSSISPWLAVFLKYFASRPIADMGQAEIREFLLYQLNSVKIPAETGHTRKSARFIKPKYSDIVIMDRHLIGKGGAMKNLEAVIAAIEYD